MSEAPQNGQVVAGKYRVRRCIGAGGMGAVYEAENLATGKRVALKWLHAHLVHDRSQSERFLREAKALAKIRHPNVVDLYDVGRDGSALFLVLEFLEGESLAAYLERELAPVQTMLTLLSDAMRGVAAAHRQGILHRDLKPENIFLARENDDGSLTPKLLDFGISKVADTAQGKLTATGLVFGTPRYMSLEQLMGRELDVRTDVYSFGVILYEALTGRPPFPRLSLEQWVVQMGNLNPTPPREVRAEIPPALEQVMLSALSHHREQRPATMEALITSLRPFQQGAARARESERVVPTSGAITGAVVRRAPRKPALLAAACAASIAGGWLLAAPEDGPPAAPEMPREQAAVQGPAVVAPAVAAPVLALGPDASLEVRPLQIRVEPALASKPVQPPAAARALLPAAKRVPAPLVPPAASGMTKAPRPAAPKEPEAGSEPQRKRTPSMLESEF